MVETATSTGSAETTEPVGGLAPHKAIDDFFIPVPTKKDKRVGKLRNEDPKKDFSLFTLDYAFRKVGGRCAAIELARLASGNDERLRGLVSGYDSLTKGQQKRRPKLLEALCIENDIDPSEFLGICTAIAHRFQLDTSSIVASVELEAVVAAGLEQAKKPEGVQDRKLIYEHSTFTPVRGPGVAVQINNAPASQGVALPEFRSLSEIALTAISRAALPPAPKEEEGGDYIDVQPEQPELDEVRGSQPT
jgi:hypothetical protein